MYLEKIELRNVRTIKELELPFDEGKLPLHSVIIGANSTCKSTILRCIAICLCEEPSTLVPDVNGLMGPEENGPTEIILQLTGGKEVKTTISKSGVIEKAERETEYEGIRKAIPVLCGYGAGRSTGASEDSGEYSVVDATYSLFRYEVHLLNPEIVLRRIKDSREEKIYRQVTKLLIQSIGLGPGHSIALGMEGVTLSGPNIGNGINLRSTADGYRIPFTWLCDFISWALLNNPELADIKEVEGLILIDELEQHLHPTLQREQLKRLKEQLPKVQIIGTTHSPMIVLGCGEEDKVFALKRKRSDAGGQESIVVLEEIAPDLSYYSVEDVYTDESLFDSKVEHPKLMEDLKKYRELSDRGDSKYSEEERKFIRQHVGKISAAGKKESDSRLLRLIEEIRKELNNES